MGGNTGIRVLIRIVTVTVAGPALALWGVRGAGPAAVGAIYLAVVTVPLVVTDVRERRLPNALVLPGYAFAAVGLVWEALARGSPAHDTLASVTVVLAGGTGVLGLFLLLVWSGGLGMGDAKLAGLLAIALGAAVPVLLWVAAVFLAAALHVVIEWVVRRGSLGSDRPEVAFGPAMLGAFWMVVVAAQ
ncbi:prepilin peptidase [Leifsonia naganoensis]|uniref:Leader peptidase (Prepilin peptidase)/N-methyltransferase n=1 Tax=Leifsonia naganoensis TaxID=150025 RepID=A0A853DXZ3_9MICO|nr:prepilin peptidase [Leifsonia naganoensis]NYK11245.1 leader peptidase (prepilin peptidase)/N-methyltransferase [Leifsonia naganoensis]